MPYKRTITFISITLFLFGCIKNTSGLRQEDIETLTVVSLNRHIKYNRFTDEISEKTLNNLINNLDPGKYYFYKNDINKFMQYKDKIDDYVDNNDYSLIFEIQETYKKRFHENLDIFNELIARNYNFNQDETIIIDRDTVDYAETKEEMSERWRKNIKLQLLNQLSIENNIEKAKKKLIKKYDLLEKRIDEIDTERMLAIFLNSFTTALDPHSNYLTQEEHEDFQISTNLKLEGIGVLLRSEDGFIIVERIIPGGPASKLPNNLRLYPDDKIIAVAQGNEEAVDVIDMALRDVVKLIRGKKGTVVKLTILRKTENKKSQPRLIIPITREEITLDDKAAKSEIYPLKKNKRELKIGYIKLPSFYMDFDGVNMNDPNARKSSRDMRTEIKRLKEQGIDGMVIDLRGNPGGALTEARDIAGMFIDEGPVVQILVEKNKVEIMEDRDPGVYYNGPVLILIDKFSASASEIFAGAIKDYQRGIIIGPDSTFGKGSVQTYNELPGNNGALKITTALFYQPGGSSNQLNGIKPDIIVPDISSVWDMGEDKLRYPLKWEMIKKAPFKEYKKYIKSNTISYLNEQSSERIHKNKKFTELIDKINVLKTKKNEKTISLKEESKIENQELKEIEKKEKQYNGDDKIIDLEHDLFLEEAFNVAYDYIDEISKKNKTPIEYNLIK